MFSIYGKDGWEGTEGTMDDASIEAACKAALEAQATRLGQAEAHRVVVAGTDP